MNKNNYENWIQREQDLLTMINHRTATSLQTIARKLEVSPTTVKRLLVSLREDGYQIRYNKGDHCFKLYD